MTSYATDHAGALADLMAAGAAVTFSETVPGAKDAATETYAPTTTSTVAGYAMQVAGDPKRYADLRLIQSEAPSLFFVPTTFGALPALLAKVTWNGIDYVVRDVAPFGPNGPAIYATVIVSR
jgi:hypothetical protein